MKYENTGNIAVDTLNKIAIQNGKNPAITEKSLLKDALKTCSPTTQEIIGNIPQKGALNHLKKVDVPYIQINELLNNYINRIIKDVFVKSSFESPLGVFQRNNIITGQAITENYIAPSKGGDYSPNNPSSAHPFAYHGPSVSQTTYGINREIYYDVTIEKYWTNKAWNDINGVSDYTNFVINSLSQGDEIERFEFGLDVIVDSLKQRAYINSNNQTVQAFTKSEQIFTKDPDKYGSTTWVEHLVEEMLAIARLFKFSSTTTSYLPSGEIGSTPTNKVVLIVDSRVATKIDMLMARVFSQNQINPTSVFPQVIDIGVFPQVDSVGTPSIPVGSQPIACLMSNDTFNIYDKAREFDTAWNPKWHYTNYFYHHHELEYFSINRPAYMWYTDPQEKPPTTVPEQKKYSNIVDSLLDVAAKPEDVSPLIERVTERVLNRINSEESAMSGAKIEIKTPDNINNNDTTIIEKGETRNNSKKKK